MVVAVLTRVVAVLTIVVAVLECRRFDVSPFLLSPFWTCRRYDRYPFHMIYYAPTIITILCYVIIISVVVALAALFSLSDSLLTITLL